MSKALIASLVAAALVLVIVIGAISAISSSNGEPVTPGNVLDGVLGNNTKDTTAAPVTTVAPGTTAAPTYESPITYLKNSNWVSMDYDAEYEPYLLEDGQLGGYYVYVKVRLSPNLYYNLTYDVSGLGAKAVSNLPYYWDVESDTPCWSSVESPSVAGSVRIKSDTNGYIKFVPKYNYEAVSFDTATEAAEFANTLKQGGFVIQITDVPLLG